MPCHKRGALQKNKQRSPAIEVAGIPECARRMPWEAGLGGSARVSRFRRGCKPRWQHSSAPIGSSRSRRGNDADFAPTRLAAPMDLGVGSSDHLPTPHSTLHNPQFPPFFYPLAAQGSNPPPTRRLPNRYLRYRTPHRFAGTGVIPHPATRRPPNVLESGEERSVSPVWTPHRQPHFPHSGSAVSLIRPKIHRTR